eukprot:4499346-Amphidinium_carterae.1
MFENYVLCAMFLCCKALDKKVSSFQTYLIASRDVFRPSHQKHHKTTKPKQTHEEFTPRIEIPET